MRLMSRIRKERVEIKGVERSCASMRDMEMKSILSDNTILEPTRARWRMSRVATRCANNVVPTSEKRIQTKQTHNELERQTYPSQVEGQTFPSHLKQNKELEKAFVLCVLAHAGHLKFRFQNGPFTKRFGPEVMRVPAVVLSISRISRLAVTRAWIFALNKLTEGDGDLQSPWPASSENVPVNYLSTACVSSPWC